MMAGTPIPMWLSFVVALVGAGGLGGIFVKLVTLRNSALEKMIVSLTKRVDLLERRAERKEMIHQLQYRSLRHRANGAASTIKAFLAMVKVAPDKALQFVELAEADIAKQDALYTKESGEIDTLIADLVREEMEHEG